MPNQENSKVSSNSPRVFVWDIYVRLFHWTLVALIVALFLTAEVFDGGIELHATLGRAILALVLFRVVWGVVGSSYARFSQFVQGPRWVLAYTMSLFSNKYEYSVGHNPLGGWMVIVLLAVVSIQAVLGMFANDDILFDGPFAYLISKDSSDYITGLHADLFLIIMVLVGLHVAAVIWHKVFKGENLLAAMFSGYKKLPPEIQAENASGGGHSLAVILLLISVIVVYFFTQ